MGGSKGTSKSTTEPPKAIMDAYKQSLGMAEQAVRQPYQQYQGQMVAGLNPTQLQGISNVNAAQGAALPYIQQGAGYVNQAAQGVNPQMINQFMSPYLNNVVNATQKNLLESNAQQLAGLKGQAIQSGAFGGDRSRFAQAELARQQGLAGGQVIGGLLNQGYGQALTGAQQNVQNMMQGGNMLGAMGMSAQQSILEGAKAQMAAGAQQQATEQTGLQALYDQFLQRQSYPYQQAQFFANIAQGIGAGAGGTTSQTPAAPSFGSQLFGGLTAIGSIFSDERVKENIVEVGKTHDGQKIYKYNYKGDNKPQIGLIAQEVEKTHPEAVSSLGGIKMVDYDKATEGAERQGKAFGGSSMGGLVTPDMQRQAFAQGGFGMVPYSDFMKGLSYVPAGELTYRGHSPGSTLPEGYKMEELEKIAQGSDFDPINSMSEKQIEGLKAGFGKFGTSMGLVPASDGADGARAPSYSGPLSNFGPGVTSFFSGVGSALGFANGGGVVPRHGYATDGAVEDGSPLPPFLVQAESGGDTQADNKLGYVGRGQFDEARLIDAKRAGVIPPDLTLEQFKSDPGVQKAVEAWHVSDVNNYIQDRGLGAFVGKTIKGIPVTEEGLLAVAHLGGKGGMAKFLKSGGQYDPADANGTKLSDYLMLASNASGVVAPEAAPADVSGVVPAVDMPAINALAMDAPEASGVVPPMPDFVAKANVEPASDEEPARNRTIIESILGRDLSDQARSGILAAGLAMLGGRSPYAGVNIGKGGLTGLQTYYSGLSNERETAVKAAEIAQKQAETEAKKQEISLAFNRAWMDYNFIRTMAGQPPVSLEEFKEILASQRSGAAPAGVPAPAPTTAPAPVSGAPEEGAGEEEAPPAPGQTEETPPTVSGGDPNTVGTLNYYRKRLEAASASLAYAAGNPDKAAIAQNQINSAKEQIDKITSSPFYITQQQATGPEYDDLRMNLLRAGELNASFQGGRGSPQVAELISLARTVGAGNLIPEDLATNPDKYDELLKLSTDLAIRQAQQSGLLKAPGQALEAESKVVFDPSMSPGARYALVVKALAIADRNRDLYAGWDTSPDTNTYISKWKAQKEKEAKEAGYPSYMDMYVDNAKKELPEPATGLPEALPEATSNALNRAFPSARDGTRKQDSTGRVAIKRNGKWEWE